jgi:hypothetical protein
MVRTILSVGALLLVAAGVTAAEGGAAQKKLKVLAVTGGHGYDEKEVTQRFVGKGLAGFIHKPYTMATLRETLKRVLG